MYIARNGPVSRVLCLREEATVISLGRRLPGVSSDLPGTESDAGRIAGFPDYARIIRCPSPPIWSCSGRGLQCPGRRRPGGGLLPRRFTLAAAGGPAEAVCFLLHFP